MCSPTMHDCHSDMATLTLGTHCLAVKAEAVQKLMYVVQERISVVQEMINSSALCSVSGSPTQPDYSPGLSPCRDCSLVSVDSI